MRTPRKTCEVAGVLPTGQFMHALEVGSPARDGGPSTGQGCGSGDYADDQRDISRPLGTACDTGAYEASFVSTGGGTDPRGAIRSCVAFALCFTDKVSARYVPMIPVHSPRHVPPRFARAELVAALRARRRSLARFGLVLLAGTLLAFGFLTESLWNSRPIIDLDREFAELLHERATPALTHLFEAISALAHDRAGDRPGDLQLLAIGGPAVAEDVHPQVVRQRGRTRERQACHDELQAVLGELRSALRRPLIDPARPPLGA